MSFVARLSALLLLCLVTGLARAADPTAVRDLLFILDGSGSMWGQVDQQPKIAVAKEVLGELIGTLDPAVDRVGLMAYGHRRKGDCDDVQTLAPIGPLDSAALLYKVRAINPKGKTPITRSVQQAVDLLRGREDPATVVLVSDGLETCGGDPCAALREARAAGVKLVMHVVGFDVAEAETEQLRCLAEAGGGRFFTARNSMELADSLEQAVQVLPVLRVRTLRNGRPIPAHVTVWRDAQEVVAGETGMDGGRDFPLEPGPYDLKAVDPALVGGMELEAAVELSGTGGEQLFDFQAGSLGIGAVSDGQPISARVTLLNRDGRPLTTRELAAEAAYNPALLQLPPGEYRVRVTAIAMEGQPSQDFDGLVVAAGERLERSADFSAGRLVLTVTADGQPTEAQVRVLEADSGRELAKRRVYPHHRNRIFPLPPGRYHVTVEAVDLEGRPVKELRNVALELGQERAETVDFGAGVFTLKVTANGELAEAQVAIVDADSGDPVVNRRLYPDARRNPGEFALPPGRYHVRVEATQVDGRPARDLRDLEIAPGGGLQREVDFSTGALSLKVTSNGELTGAQVRITQQGSARPLVNRRLYPDARRNPAVYTLAPGTYHINVVAMEMEGRPARDLGGVIVPAGETVEQAVDFSSGALKLLVTINEDLGEAQVRIQRSGSARAVVNQRIYPDARRNPAAYDLPPGVYDIKVTAHTLEGRTVKELRDVTVRAGETEEQRVDFSAGELRLTVTAGGALAEAQVRITPAGQSRSVTNQRIYPDSRRNPVVYALPPGEYTIRVEGTRLPGRPVRELRKLKILAGGVQEQTVDLPVP